MTQLSSAIQSAFAAVDRVFEFLNEEEQLEDKKTSVKLERPRGNVSFEHVKFGYSDDKILIHDLNAEIKAGQCGYSWSYWSW